MTTTTIAALVTALLMLALVGGASPAAARDQVLDDLLFDLQLSPLDGSPAPGFELERLGDGQKVTLAQHRGRPVLLYFWASW